MGCREGEDYVPDDLDPKVVEVYQGVGKVLSRYTAGKVSAGGGGGILRVCGIWEWECMWRGK